MLPTLAAAISAAVSTGQHALGAQRLVDLYRYECAHAHAASARKRHRPGSARRGSSAKRPVPRTSASSSTRGYAFWCGRGRSRMTLMARYPVVMLLRRH